MAPRNGNGKKRLGDILVERGSISAEDLRRALDFQRRNGAKLGEALVILGFIDYEELAEGLAAQKKLTVIPLPDLYPNPRAVSLLTERFIRSREVLPVDFERDALVLAMVDPLDVVTLDDVRVMVEHDVIPVVATKPAFEETVDNVFSGKGELGTDHADNGDTPRKIIEDSRAAEDGSVVRLIDEILDTAIKRRASDIHFEPQLYDMQVRLRIDGVLHPLTEAPTELKGGLVSRIKIMGDMDIAEKRLPQDGRATYRSPEQTVELRIATMPSVFGENVTIRLLDETMFEVSLEKLGMDEVQLRLLQEALATPHGQVLITGPTGSGKSTTLYAALEWLNEPQVKIYTVEDPVERKVPGIIQTQMKSSIGLTFARALRSLVRGDPDIIMVGEIRDLETAMIATEASLTGHLVMSTLHTNDAPSTVTRLAEMGVPPYLISSALVTVVAQRLARRLCSRCRKEIALEPGGMTPAERDFFGDRAVSISRAVGCPRCFGTGYSGRTGLFEVLPITKEIRRMILDGADADDLRDHARNAGMISLQEDGRRKVLGHVTTMEEIERVTA